jgi:hypothetical protein
MNQPEFLRHKVKLMVAAGDFGDSAGARDHAERWESLIAKAEAGDHTASFYKSIEEELNAALRMAVYPKAKRDAIKGELTEKFGSHSLGASDEQVVKKVLKRGKIETEDEFYVIKELVVNFADQEGEDDDDITEEQRTKLDGIMTNWELGK